MYCDLACEFVSTCHTSVCMSSSKAFGLIGGLDPKEVLFFLSVSCCKYLCSTNWLKDSIKWIQVGYETLSMMVDALVDVRFK